MVTFESIYTALDKQDVRLYVYPIGFAPAATIECGGKYAVFLDAEQGTAGGLRRMKQYLCHECGHCATGATHAVSGPYDLIEKHEYKANRWAIEHFIPFDALQQAVQRGYTQPWQLAEYFDMPQEFVQQAVRHYTQIRQKNLFAFAQNA